MKSFKIAPQVQSLQSAFRSVLSVSGLLLAMIPSNAYAQSVTTLLGMETRNVNPDDPSLGDLVEVFEVVIDPANGASRNIILSQSIVKTGECQPTCAGDNITKVFTDEYNGKVYGLTDSEGVWVYDASAPIPTLTFSQVGYGKGVSASPNFVRNLIRFEPNGLHIGENSLVTREENGAQILFAEDANNNALPINITNGSDLLINGKSVQGQIDNNRQNINDLGRGTAGATALVSAMTALPVTSDDAPFSCGTGTGAYSSRYAMSFGCAARVSNRLSLNAGGSYVFGGSSDYGNGSLSSFAGRAGFVFKIGNLTQTNSTSQVSHQIEELRAGNTLLRQENSELKLRLERIEKLVLSNSKR